MSLQALTRAPAGVTRVTAVCQATKVTVLGAAIAGSLLLGASLGAQAQAPAAASTPASAAGWVSLFDGVTLNGWDGRADVWRVDAGTITGEVAHGPTSVSDTTYLLWTGGEVSNFELTAEVRTEGRFVNTGIVYRGFVIGGAARGAGAGAGRGNANAPYRLGGPQLDFDAALRYAGQYLEVATDRPLRVPRGQIREPGATTEVIGSLGNDQALGARLKPNDWNHLRIIAYGRTIIHMVNGQATSILVDSDAARFRASGMLGLQLEGAGRVRFRNISLSAR